MELSLLSSLALVAVLAGVSQWLAWRLRLPSILLLLGTGLLAGPVLGWLDPDRVLGDLLRPSVALAVGLILFEGGLSLELRELKGSAGPVARLASVGVAMTWTLATAAGVWVAGLSLELALLLGALMTVTGPTVIGPLLNHVRPQGQSGPILKWEGIVGDVIGATLAVLVLHALVEGHEVDTQGVLSVSGGLLRTLGAGALAGALGTAVLVVPIARRWVPDHLEAPLAFCLALGVYALGDALSHEAGLLAVTLMGFVLVNQRRVPVAHVVEFLENTRVLLIGALFVVLAATLRRSDLALLTWRDAGYLVVLLLVVRPAAVAVSLLGTQVSRRERWFLAGVAPRGVVAVAISSLFASRLAGIVPGAERLGPLAFLVIVGTVTVYSLGAGPLARALGLSVPDPQGLLLIGGTPFAASLSERLRELGIACVIVDSNRRRAAELRLAGHRAVALNALSSHPETHVPMGGLGRALALTPNDEVNRLVALHFTEYFGRSGVYQLALPPEREAGEAALRGRDLFVRGTTFADLAGRMARGATVRATHLTEDFDLEDWEAHHGPRGLPLGRITEAGRLVLFTHEAEPQAAPGETLLALVEDDPEALARAQSEAVARAEAERESAAGDREGADRDPDPRAAGPSSGGPSGDS